MYALTHWYFCQLKAKTVVCSLLFIHGYDHEVDPTTSVGGG